MSTATTRNDGARWRATRSLTHLGLMLVGALVTVPGCGGKSKSGTDSNTHWYQQCATDDDCGALSCSCGVCTQTCEAASDCSDLGERAECATVSGCEQGTSSTLVCLAQCRRNEDCATLGKQLVCDNGHCLLASDGTAGGGGAGGNETSPATGGASDSDPDSSDAGGSNASAGGSTGLGGTSSTTGGLTESGGIGPVTGGSPASGGSGTGTGGAQTTGGLSSGGGTAAGGSISAAGGAGGFGGASATSGGAGLPGEEGGHGGIQESGGTTGTAAEGGMAPISGGGAAGASSDPARLVLDPESLTFFQLPTGSIRFAVAGYDPTARVCATLVWSEATSGTPSGAQCDVDTDRTPYVFLETDTDGPCDGWDYEGNVDTLGWSGCSGFAESGETNVNLIDAEIEVEGPLFIGTIVADNRASGGVSFGFRYLDDTPQSVYVQSVAMTGTPDWLAVTRDGAPVQIFDPCDLPTCGTEEGVCGAAFPQVQEIAESSYAGSIYYQWDGLVRTADAVNNCWLEASATPGTYQVEICYGFGTVAADFGNVVADPVCVIQDFTYPTDQVIVTVHASE